MVVFIFSLFIALDYFLYLKNIIHRTHSINLNLLIFLQQHSNNTQTPFILSTHHSFFLPQTSHSLIWVQFSSGHSYLLYRINKMKVFILFLSDWLPLTVLFNVNKNHPRTHSIDLSLLSFLQLHSSQHSDNMPTRPWLRHDLRRHERVCGGHDNTTTN